VLAAKQPTADTEHHRPVAAYDLGERIFFAANEKSLEQNGIGSRNPLVASDSATNAAKDIIDPDCRHAIPPDTS
jgi:hypothetical protein